MLYFSNHTEESNDILLLSHLDYIYGMNDFVPFHENRGHYYGSGIAKSKGGLAIMLSALSALRSVRDLRKIKCGILLTTDYSIGGIYSRNLVDDKSRKSKYRFYTFSV